MTGTLMVLLLLLLAIIAYVGVQRRSAKSRHEVATNRELTLFDLKVGDIVQHDATDWVVEDRLVYRQGEFSWLGISSEMANSRFGWWSMRTTTWW